MDEKGKSKLAIGIMITIAVVVICLASVMYLIRVGFGNSIGVPIVLVAIVIVNGAIIYYFAREFKNLKRGFPLKDEMLKRTVEKASAKSFLGLVYIMLAVNWYNILGENFGMSELGGMESINLSLISGLVLFFVLLGYHKVKGVVD